MINNHNSSNLPSKTLLDPYAKHMHSMFKLMNEFENSWIIVIIHLLACRSNLLQICIKCSLTGNWQPKICASISKGLENVWTC